jgi:putative ABC transport system permease protein
MTGVTTFVVGQRRQELRVRIALGASGRDMMRLLLTDNLRPVMFGLASGILAALLASRVLAGTLYGIGSADPSPSATRWRCC